MNAADGVFHDYTQPKDMDSSGEHRGLVELFKGFPDAMLEAASMWGAGDYVVTEGTFSGTNKGAVPMMGIKKPTGKAAKVRFLEITKIEGGKIKEDWLVFDSMAFATAARIVKNLVGLGLRAGSYTQLQNPARRDAERPVRRAPGASTR
jgi:predicted ester cyclase